MKPADYPTDMSPASISRRLEIVDELWAAGCKSGDLKLMQREGFLEDLELADSVGWSDGAGRVYDLLGITYDEVVAIRRGRDGDPFPVPHSRWTRDCSTA
jgi:hypothetical protein